MTISELMSLVPRAFQPERAAGVEALIQGRLSGREAGDWLVTIRDGACTVAEGLAENAGLTVEVDSDDLLDLAAGKANPMALYMQGRIKVQGDIGLAIRVAGLFGKHMPKD